MREKKGEILVSVSGKRAEEDLAKFAIGGVRVAIVVILGLREELVIEQLLFLRYAAHFA